MKRLRFWQVCTLAGQSVQHCVPLVHQMGSLSKAEVEEKLAVLVGEDITTKLRSANWKERLEAMGDLQQLMQDIKENTDVPLLFQVCTCDGCSPSLPAEDGTGMLGQ